MTAPPRALPTDTGTPNAVVHALRVFATAFGAAQLAMSAMNAEPDPEAEDRKGCSGHVGKMIFSAATQQLAESVQLVVGAYDGVLEASVEVIVCGVVLPALLVVGLRYGRG